MLNLAIVIGSVRAGRQSHKAAYYLERKLKERKDVSVKVIDLLEYEVPLLEERYRNLVNPADTVKRAAEILNQADAIILVSPEYHGGMSGVLKNFLDYYTQEITRKPIGVVTASGGKFGGINASLDMQKFILAIGSFPMPKKFIVPFISQAFDDEYNVLNDEVSKSGEGFLDDFVWFANAINNAKVVSTKAAA